MRKSIIILSTLVLALGFCVNSSFAEMPAAKATAQVVDLTAAELGQGWVTVLEQKIKTPNKKDLFIDASFEVGLTTNTAVMSRKLERAIAEAEAQVQVRVLLDNNDVYPIDPGVVVFEKRHQTLVAEFAGMYDLWTEAQDGDPACYSLTYACVDQDTEDPCYPDVDASDGCCTGTQVTTGISFSYDDACFDPEFIQIILDTLAAHSFNFIATDVEPGVHEIDVQVKLTYDLGDGVDIFSRADLLAELGDNNAIGLAGSTAWVGKGSVTIESVRMINKDDGVNSPPEIPEI